MNKSNLLGITLTAALLVSLLFAATPLIVSAQSAPTPCFYFLSFDSPVEGTGAGAICSTKANDITVIFKADQANCILSIGSPTVTAPCPSKANNVEFNFSLSATSGSVVLTSCVWTHGKRILSVCTVPAGSTGFTINNTPITKVFWTLNVDKLGKAIPAPTTECVCTVNGVMFSTSVIT